jgi:hypothetical protein
MSVSYLACKVCAPFYIVICNLCGYTIFFHIISQTVRFSEKNITEHKTCVLILSTILPELLLILRTVERNTINIRRASCNVRVTLGIF